MPAKTELATARTFAVDLLERALNSAWQGAAAGLAPVILAADTTNAISAAWWQQALTVAGMGAVAGVLSLAKGLAAGAKTGTGSLSSSVAQTAVVPDPTAAPPVTADALLPGDVEIPSTPDAG